MKSWSVRDAKASVGPGWWPILSALYVAKPRSVTVQQVKEKYGTLRFYCSGGDESFNLLVTFAEQLSGFICEACGKEGKLIIIRGWYMTRCKECERKEKEQHGNEVAGR